MSSNKKGTSQQALDDGNDKKAHQSDVAHFPIVGIGASAGGLQAFEALFNHLPAQPEMAFVLVQHLAPEYESELHQILQKHTQMPVRQVIQSEKIQINHVYVIPPGQNLSVKNGILYLSPPTEPRGLRTPIDLFFHSLAEDQGKNAICLILSGTGSDGMLGLKQIKEMGGVVFVQDPDDARHDGMPRSALRTGLIDIVAPVAELAQKLVTYRQSTEKIPFPKLETPIEGEQASILQRIFTQLHSQTGADFSQYKQATILRRIQRRMQVTQTVDLHAYYHLLRQDRTEAEFLQKELLISVTNFFRDPEAWAVLEKAIIPSLFDDKNSDDSIRIWVPGCATGEEAYSIAMLLVEEARRRGNAPSLQIFATDINSRAVRFARAGLYPVGIEANVSPERLKRFFEFQGDAYQVKAALQEIILFAEHNLIQDAPFAHLDLVSCRNLFIYLKRDIQKHVFKILRYALNEGGYLFLGNSESAERVSHLFSPVFKRERIYRAEAGKLHLPILPVKPGWQALPDGEETIQSNKYHQQESRRVPLGDVHRQLMLERYAPPSVLVDEGFEIRYKFGDVGRYLHHQEGVPTLNLLDNVNRRLESELRSGLFAVFRDQKPIMPRQVTFKGLDGSNERVRIRIEPVSPREGVDQFMALVIFESVPDRKRPLAVEDDDQGVASTRDNQFEEEIKALRHRLQTTSEQFETSNEELKTSNEELQSMNEELRSSAEELETSREELRSTNEELTSVNQELKIKVEEIKEANSDLINLMEATNIATLFLDRALRLKRYTPEAKDVFHLIPSDIDRPFSHISHKLRHETLSDLAEHVLKSLETVEMRVPSRDNRWYLLGMRPYRTVENKIDGVVMTLVEITALIQAENIADLRADQQAIVAELGILALRNFPLEELIDRAVQKAAVLLKVEFTKVLELIPGTDELFLKSGLGWQEGLVGSATVDTGLDSQAGYTLHSDKPVVVKDLRTETRFRGPALLTDHGVVSGISVIIHGLDGPYGVFGAHTREYREFTREDTDFLQGLANVLAASIENQAAEAKQTKLIGDVQAEQQRLAAILQQMPAAVIIASAPDGKLIMGNELVEKIWRRPFTKAEGIPDYATYRGLHLDGTPVQPEAWPLARAIATGEVIRGEEIIIERGDGTRGVISNSAAPILNDSGEIVAGVVIFQDVTQRKAVEKERDQLLTMLQKLNATLEDKVEMRTRELRKRNEQVSNMAAALTVAEQRERERISRILHDDLQQLLHAVQIRLTMLHAEVEKLGNTAVQKEVTALDQINSQALSVARSLMVELRPPVLEGEGLKEALSWLAGHMETVHNLEVNLHIKDDVSPANADLSELAFQIVRELLFNVVKHADVQTADLYLEKVNGRCQITIADQGKGFDKEQLTKKQPHRAGYGLHHIQERLELFDGTFAINTNPEEGTHIVFTLACDDSSSNKRGGDKM